MNGISVKVYGNIVESPINEEKKDSGIDPKNYNSDLKGENDYNNNTVEPVKKASKKDLEDRNNSFPVYGID